jgi:hypothetical protein
MRETVVSIFLQAIEPHLGNIDSIAVVGGSKRDPEVVELEKIKNFVVTTYGIDDDSDFKLDLNLSNKMVLKYDLVICSQVLEHVYDVKYAIANLVNLLEVNSLLWIACPASNRSHGSPEYFSAGYQPELIINLAQEYNLELIKFGKLGSKRLYFFTHALRVWPNQKELYSPIFKYDFNRFSGSKIKNIFRFFRDFPGRLFATFLSPKVNEQVEFATETFVLFQKSSLKGN